MGPAGSRRALPEAQDVAGDDHALDFGGALADLGELGVAEDSLDRKLRDVTGPPVDLERLGGRLHGHLGGEDLGHGGGGFGGLPRILEGGGPEGEQAGGLDLGAHIGDYALQAAELGGGTPGGA